MTVHPLRSRFTQTVALLLSALLASVVFVMVSPSTAHADEVNTDLPYSFSGNVRYGDEHLAGVTINVSGNGYDVDVRTDLDGKWKVGVPEKSAYDVTLIESTLPLGVSVDYDRDDYAHFIRTDKGATIKAEFGLTDRKTVNFFLSASILVPTESTESPGSTPPRSSEATTTSDASTPIIIGLAGVSILLLGGLIVVTVLLVRKRKRSPASSV